MTEKRDRIRNYTEMLEKMRESCPPALVDQLVGYSARKLTFDPETGEVVAERVVLDPLESE